MLTIDSVNLRSWHRAILLFFTMAGMTGASMMVRLPLIREMLGVSNGELGLLLVAGSIGAMSGLLFVGKFIAHRGTRAGIILGFSIWCFGMLLVASGLALHNPILFALGNFFGGVGGGMTDVGINVDGSAIEQKLGRAAMPKMHAAFSIGTLIGAGLGTIAIQLNLSVAIQVAVLAVICFILPMTNLGKLPTDNGLHSEEEKAGKNEATFSKVVVLLGLGIFGMTLAEGASNDWLTIAVVDDYKQSTTVAGSAYSVLLLSMALTRFFGGNLADRFGRALTLRGTALAGIIGLITIIAGVNFSIAFAYIGAVLWGIGVALAFPLFLSAAGEQPQPAKTVALVTTFGYTAFLVGPPLLGLLGQAVGVTNMYWVITLFLIASFIAAGSAGNTRARKPKLGVKPLEVDIR